jgi:YegS/Rv2252/BmrU family lipid kinase
MVEVTKQTHSTRRAPATHRLDVIINPAAGAGRAGRRWPEIADTLARHGFISHTCVTSGPGHATTIARHLAAGGATTIICVGGDGTANEVVNGLLDGDRPVNPETRLALIPCGTGKDLGRSLGTRDVGLTITALRAGQEALIDVGRARFIDARTGHLATRYFANVADTGIGAATAARINAQSKALGGFVSYFAGAVQSITTYRPWDVVVDVDERRVHAGPASIVVFANGRYFAGGMHVAPAASLCDGRFDVFVCEGVGRRTLLTSILPRVYRGRHVGQPGVIHVTGASATVHGDGMLFEMDGEQVGRAPVSVDVLPRVLRVVAAPGSIAVTGGCGDGTL